MRWTNERQSDIKDLFSHTIQAAHVLGDSQDMIQTFMRVCHQLRPTAIGKSGQIQEWANDWDDDAPDPHHRHTSHSYALNPSCQIQVDEHPELAIACKSSLLARGDPGTGWATAWRLALWARLQDGEAARR